MSLTTLESVKLSLPTYMIKLTITRSITTSWFCSNTSVCSSLHMSFPRSLAMVWRASTSCSCPPKISVIWKKRSYLTNLFRQITTWTTLSPTRSCWHHGTLTVEHRASSPNGPSKTWICSRTMTSRIMTSHWMRWRLLARPFHSTFIHMSRMVSSIPLVIILPPHQPCTPGSMPSTGWRRSIRTFASWTLVDLTCCLTQSARRRACSSGSRGFPLCSSLARRTPWTTKLRSSWKKTDTSSGTSHGKSPATSGPNSIWNNQENRDWSKFHNGWSRRTCLKWTDYLVPLLKRNFVIRAELTSK